MILLKVLPGGIQPGLLFFMLILRILGALVCSSKAKELNRTPGGWGFFGFIMPVMAMIWIHSVKSKVVWDSNVANDTIA